MLFSILFKCPVIVGQRANRLGVLYSFLCPRMALYVQILQRQGALLEARVYNTVCTGCLMLFLTLFKCPIIVGQRANRQGIHLLVPTSQNSHVGSNSTAAGPCFRTQGKQYSLYRASDVAFDLVQVSRNCGTSCGPPGHPFSRSYVPE